MWSVLVSLRFFRNLNMYNKNKCVFKRRRPHLIWHPMFYHIHNNLLLLIVDIKHPLLYFVFSNRDAAQSAGFHPTGAVVAVGTQTGRYGSQSIPKCQEQILNIIKLKFNQSVSLTVQVAGAGHRLQGSSDDAHRREWAAVCYALRSRYVEKIYIDFSKYYTYILHNNPRTAKIFVRQSGNSLNQRISGVRFLFMTCYTVLMRPYENFFWSCFTQINSCGTIQGSKSLK